MTHRLVVDLTRCRGHGICVLLAPERVDLDRWGFPIVDEAGLDEKPLLRRAIRAAAACPRRALSVVEVPDVGGSRQGGEPHTAW